ncbi:phospholipid/cholesterol/gamma-HCH transport system substrate-binding protein [Nocardioides thalensis]|uniref:Phospholipid/cholesterol/gamma-HCH transport system substrate-binding protein n=1 Tax=Nocardioides thalensis TaxID=1914755 RepID=A0A853C279_9ACTN|nr:MCE family protein [Nocardioides thalensis]NYJ01106.1 phospholipid/cholesterol/gamma-HCH transport system substrate-binding protein [Nocardioides thalensis]
MKPVNEWNSFRIGLIGIGVGLLVAVGVIVMSTTNFGTKEYTAVLEHTAGLRSGEDVQVHGVVKGEVTGVDLEDDHVVVTFVLESDIDLGSRTEASVKVATLLGTHYLELEPLGGGTLAGDRIPLDRTEVPYNLQDVLESGAGALDELDPELLADALTSMADTLGASSDEIGPALKGVARLSEVVANRSDQAGDLLESARNVSDQLSDSSADIVELMSQTNLVVSEITARRDAIHRLLVETTGLSRALTEIVDSTKGDLKPALEDLNDVLAMLNREDETLTRVLDVMGPAVRYVANASGHGPWVDLFIQEPALPPDDAMCGSRGGCR